MSRQNNRSNLLERPMMVRAGVDAIILYFADHISESANQRVQQFRDYLQRNAGDWITELVPAYSSLLVYYDVLQRTESQVKHSLKELLESLDDASTSGEQQQVTEHVIEVYYDQSVGPDLARVAKQHGLSVEQVIEKHQQQSYRVYAVGFAPGFAYLGEVAEDLQTPRLDSPRDKVAAGSVAIAERQTAVYPLPSPGGWNIIGRTAKTLYDPSSGELNTMKSGDRVRFTGISKEAFLAQGGLLDE